MAIIASTLARIKSDPLVVLGGKDKVNRLFAGAGHVWRDRVFDPATTLGLFVLQILHGNTAMTHLRHLCGKDVCPQSYCDARARLGLATLAAVIEQLCRSCIPCTQDAASTWRGRRVLIADATTVTTPDVPALQTLWPQPSVQKSGCGFPMIKLLGLIDLATGMIHQLSAFCQRTHEMSQAAGLATMLRGRDVLLADRGFCSFVHLAMLWTNGVDAVFRMHQKQIVDFTPNRPHQPGGRKRHQKRHQHGVPTSRFVRRLGQEDQLVEWIKPSKKPDWMLPGQHEQLLATLCVRELRYHIILRGRRTHVVTIATTLLDPMRYPKDEIARLYGLRWEIETNFRHLKQTMKMDRLKCKTADGVVKELLVFMLVYNLIRAAMLAAATRQNADPNRISFIDTLRFLWSLTPPPKDVSLNLIVNRIRAGRWQPRVQKRRPKEYDFMTKPRIQYIQPLTDSGVTD